MFGFTGFADCDGEGCSSSDVLKIGLVPGSMLYFDVKQLTPKGWLVVNEGGVLKLYCPECVSKREADEKKAKLKVVPS